MQNELDMLTENFADNSSDRSAAMASFVQDLYSSSMNDLAKLGDSITSGFKLNDLDFDFGTGNEHDIDSGFDRTTESNELERTEEPNDTTDGDAETDSDGINSIDGKAAAKGELSKGSEELKGELKPETPDTKDEIENRIGHNPKVAEELNKAEIEKSLAPGDNTLRREGANSQPNTLKKADDAVRKPGSDAHPQHKK